VIQVLKAILETQETLEQQAILESLELLVILETLEQQAILESLELLAILERLERRVTQEMLVLLETQEMLVLQVILAQLYTTSSTAGGPAQTTRLLAPSLISAASRRARSTWRCSCVAAPRPIGTFTIRRSPTAKSGWKRIRGYIRLATGPSCGPPCLTRE
jgi:hypothetical protein